ncbi:hypothetical protein N6B10_006659 [Pseudomonas aeruginosa]|nr:hypothetical protein [Pseudomonas aeruginosa]EJV1463661.1 hypothetical protein [Pseudomonas aeruginosa]
MTLFSEYTDAELAALPDTIEPLTMLELRSVLLALDGDSFPPRSMYTKGLVRGGKREPQKIPPFRIVEFFGGVVRGMTTRQRLPHLSEALWRDAETPGNSATPVPGPQ